MTTHTPGPWVIDGRMVTAGRNVTIALLCEMDSFGNVYDAPNPADGQLIAAAPELLEALQAAVDCGIIPISSAREGGAVRHARQAVVADMVRDAIDKATGDAS